MALQARAARIQVGNDIEQGRRPCPPTPSRIRRPQPAVFRRRPGFRAGAARRRSPRGASPGEPAAGNRCGRHLAGVLSRARGNLAGDQRRRDPADRVRGLRHEMTRRK